jgi:O-antigen biosynthesis protein
MRVPILMYHRIGDGLGNRRYTVRSEDFAAQMALVAEGGYQVIDLDALLAGLDGVIPLPAHPVAITFDDGLLDTFDRARPLLLRHSFPATFFLVTGLMGRTSEWMARGRHRPASLLDWHDASSLVAEGFVVGSHSVSHPRLDTIEPARALGEIVDSKRDLEDRLGAPVRHFAYPYGSFDRNVRDLVAEAGYASACSVQSGFNSTATDRFALRRIDVFGGLSLRTFARNLRFGENDMTTARLLRYYAGRFAARVGVRH